MTMKTMKEMRETTNGQTRALYHLNYWDGPISGVCLYNGKKCYFDTIEEVNDKILLNDKEWEIYQKEMLEYDPDYKFNEDDRWEWDCYRIYGIYETPEDVMEILEENHELFCKFVGTHTDYDMNGKRGVGARIPMRPDHPEDIGDLRPYTDHDKFYKAERRQPKMDKDNWTILEKFVTPW